MDMKILALIPARGGSKGIPKKNIRPFNGKPLIAHSIECAKRSPRVDRIVVSTDSEEIAEIARAYGADVPFLRPSEMAGDTSKVMDAVIHAIETLKAAEGYEPTHVLLLQTTSPMRTPEDIDRAVEILTERNADGVVSVCRTENLLMTKNDNDVLTILNAEQLGTTNRQLLPTVYKLDGCMIYLIKTDVLLRERSFFAGKLVGYEIDRWRAVDLDEPQDFVVGEMIQRNAEEIAKRIEQFSSNE